jgi:RNase adaptor protein for sRNA GlmZ degradation
VALKNSQLILQELSLKTEIPYLISILEQLPKAPVLQKYLPNKKTNNLHVQINSFSYKKGLPKDKSENGGGFVFDCRAIHNPGRFEQYKKLSGKDKPVIEFLKTVPEMDEFLAHVFEMVDASVQKYIERDFTSLMVNFGCTGGQHRSVYSAERLAEHLKNKFNITMELKHIEQDNW